MSGQGGWQGWLPRLLMALSVVAFLGAVYSGFLGMLMGFQAETYWRGALLLAVWAIGIGVLGGKGGN